MVPDAAKVIPPEAWRGQGGVNANIASDWWQGFGDPILASTVERALSSNVDIAIAAARIEETRAQFRFVRGQLLPNASVASTVRRERFLNAFGDGTYQTIERADIGVSYELDFFGRLRNASETARAQLLASEAARDNVVLAVASTVAAGYIGLRALDARLVVLTETLSARESSLRVAQRRAQTGYATQLELHQAESEYRATEQQIPVIRLAIARQEDALCVLLGTNPQPIERGLPLAELTSAPIPGALPAELLRRRPDLAQAEQQVAAADRSLDAVRSAFMPQIQLSATVSYVDSTLFGDPLDLFSLGGSVLAPIYQGGRLNAQADMAAARRDQSAFAYRKLALNAFREVEDALAALQHTSEQEHTLRKQRDALDQALSLARNRYRAGYSSYLEELDAQRGLLAAELSLVQATADRLAAAVILYGTLGGGWSIP